MNVNVFLELVEIRTKLASLFPYLVGLLFSIYYFNSVHWLYTLLFFIAMITFDMATTAINNFMDFKKAKNMNYKYKVNVIGRENLSSKMVRNIIIGMITFASLIGIYLTFQTSLLLLAMGGICFFIGIFYTAGPVPLSRMPLGEVFSGITMGFGIFFITVYVNCFQLSFLQLQLNNWQFAITGDIIGLLVTLLISSSNVFLIADIMLANNTCDLEEDIANHRYTLPYYIGRKNSVILFNACVYGAYLAVFIAFITGIYTWPILIVFLTLPKAHKQLATFNKEQIKHKTFVVAIKNLVLFNASYLIGLLFCIIYSYFI